MRIECPLCGTRDRREFYYAGHAGVLDRPNPAASVELWDDYMHNRDNPAGPTDDLWLHEFGCGAWLVVRRDTVSHAVISARLAKGDQL